MLPAARHHVARLHSKHAPFQICRLDFHDGLPPHCTANGGQTEAALLLRFERSLHAHQARIDVHDATIALVVTFALRDKHSERFAHLGSRESVAICLVHDANHLLGKIADSLVDFADWLCAPPQHRVWMQHKDSHGAGV